MSNSIFGYDPSQILGLGDSSNSDDLVAAIFSSTDPTDPNSPNYDPTLDPASPYYNPVAAGERCGLNQTSSELVAIKELQDEQDSANQAAVTLQNSLKRRLNAFSQVQQQVVIQPQNQGETTTS